MCRQVDTIKKILADKYHVFSLSHRLHGNTYRQAKRFFRAELPSMQDNFQGPPQKQLFIHLWSQTLFKSPFWPTPSGGLWAEGKLEDRQRVHSLNTNGFFPR